MGRGYSKEEIRERLISVLEDSESGMSGVEISDQMKISRITMTKYLKVFAAEGLVRQKDIGNITLWFLEPGQESFRFPEDYFRVAPKFLDHLVRGDERGACSIIQNSLRSGAGPRRLALEVILPAIDAARDLFEEGKIGTAEQNLLRTTISKAVQVLGQIPVSADPKKNAVVISADFASSLASEVASAVLCAEGWRVSHLGDMSSAADVLFDLDFQKLIGKVWKQKPGIMIVMVFSDTGEGLNFFADSINPARSKSGRRMKLALCGAASKKTEADLVTDKMSDVLQWSQTAYENQR